MDAKMRAMQDARELAARSDPRAAGHVNLEAGVITEMPVMSEGPLRADWVHPDEER